MRPYTWAAALATFIFWLAAITDWFDGYLASGNIMLLLAAGVCGLFWGFLYLRTGSILLNVISHTVWDVAIFLIFPVSG